MKCAIFEVSLRVDDSVGVARGDRDWDDAEPEVYILNVSGWLGSSDVPMEASSVEEIVDKFNALSATERFIRFRRGNRFAIPLGEKESNILYSEGGGCGVWSQYFVSNNGSVHPNPPQSFCEFISKIRAGTQLSFTF